MDTLRRALRQTHVTVVGDVMADEYMWGECTRISPEAPVPVVLVERHTTVPGGAANVAMGIAALGGAAGLVGVVGDDASGRQVATLLRDHGVDSSGLVIDASRPTTAKTRIMAGSQQVVRADVESTIALDANISRRLLEHVKERLTGIGAVVLSDYSKGVMTREIAQGVICQATDLGIPVIVDPKGVAYDRFEGATLVTPNVHEAERVTGLDLRQPSELYRGGVVAHGDDSWCDSGDAWGADGMTLFDPTRGEPVDFAARARAVFDVTGAGDTVVAAMAVSLGCELGLEVGAHLATAAAAAVIAKVGTSTASLEDIEANHEDVSVLSSVIPRQWEG